MNRNMPLLTMTKFYVYACIQIKGIYLDQTLNSRFSSLFSHLLPKLIVNSWYGFTSVRTENLRKSPTEIVIKRYSIRRNPFKKCWDIRRKWIEKRNKPDVEASQYGNYFRLTLRLTVTAWHAQCLIFNLSIRPFFFLSGGAKFEWKLIVIELPFEFLLFGSLYLVILGFKSEQ